MHFKSFSITLLIGLLFSCACFFLASCDQRDEAAITALVLEKVESNVAAFKKKQLTRCHKEAMDLALEKADSIVLAQALAAKDTSRFSRPIKPKKPIVTIPSETVPIAPLFNKELEVKN